MNAQKYRAKARELREKASTVRGASGRDQLLEMADHYDWLAKQAEKRERKAKAPREEPGQ
jgi:hypothetical protein